MSLLETAKIVPGPSVDTGNDSLQSATPLALMDLIPYPVAYISKNSRYEYVNKAYCEWYGIESSNIIGKTARECLRPDVYDEIKDHIKKALKGEKVIYQSDVPYNNGYRTVKAEYIPQFDANESVHGYLAIMNDVSDKREVEEVNAGLAAIVQYSEDPIIGKSLDGIVTSWNPAAQKLFDPRGSS